MLYLRQWRLYRKLTLKELASLTQIDFRVLSKYELDVIDPVSKKIKSIAEALGIEPGALYGPPPAIPAADEREEVSRA
jgi:transcriptional regulator with XRE-family HTH domain